MTYSTVFVFVGACYKHARIQHTRIMPLYTKTVAM